MRTKQPIRAKRDHFMYLDSLESDDLVVEPVKVLIKQKQAAVALSKAKLGHEPVSPTHSPISIFAPMSVQPPRMKLPEAVAKPSLPSASVWPLAAAFPFGKRVWSSSRQHEVMEEWLDEVVLQKRAKMAFKGASEWPEKNRKEKTKHRCLHEKFWEKKRQEKKRTHERTVLADHAHELARLEDGGVYGSDGAPCASQRTLYLLQKTAQARKPPRENAPLRAKTRRALRRAAQGARCLENFGDGDNLAVVPTQAEIRRRCRVAAAVAEAAVQYELHRAYALLRREPTGPALAELFKRGVPLSIDATKDMTDLLEHKAAPKEPKSSRASSAAQGRGGGDKPGKAKQRGPGSLRHASSNGTPGKRSS